MQNLLTGWRQWRQQQTSSRANAVYRAAMESLEGRQLLSATLATKAAVKPTVKPVVRAIVVSTAGPTAPIGFAAATISTTQINLTWTAVTGADGFVIKRGTDGTTFGTTLDTSAMDGTETSFHDTTASAGTKYYYEIESSASDVDSAPSLIVNATTLPAKPTLTATPANTSVALSWSAITGATSYKLEQSIDAGTTWTIVTPAPAASATTATVSKLTADKAYKFRLTASDAAGAGAASTAVATTTLLAAPGAITAKSVSKNQIDLSWAAVTSADLNGYTVEISTDGGHTFTDLADVDASTTKLNDTRLTPGTAYQYELIATNDGGDSAPSKPVTATTLLNTPNGFSASSVSATEIDLSWSGDSDAGITGFKIESSADGGLTWKTLATAKATDSTFKNTGLATDSTFTYRLSANNAGGSSKPTRTSTATTLLLPPANVKAVTASKTEIDLSWTPVADATGYHIDSSTDGTSFLPLDGLSLNGDSAGTAITGLTAGTKYFFRVATTSESGYVGFSPLVNATTLLAAPTGLAGSAVSSSEIDLSWSADSDTGLTGIKVEQSTDNGTTWTAVTTAKATATTFNVTKLIDDTAYKYRISAISAAGTSQPGSTVTKTTLLIAPTDLKATAASKTAINLAWTAIDDATTYKIEKSPDAGTTWTDISPSGDNALSGDDAGLAVTGLSAGTAYSFRISATDSAGTSTPSTAVAATTLLAAPTGLAVNSDATTATSLTYTWTADADAGLTGILAEASSDGGSTWASLGTLKPSVTTISLSKLNSNATYRVRLSAINAGGTSAPSTAVVAKTLLTAPTNLHATAASKTQINLTWTAVTGASTYKVEQSADAGHTWTDISPTGDESLLGTDNNFSVVGLTAGTAYSFRISATNTSGNSLPSTVASTSTLLAAPTGLAVNSAATTATSLTYTWTADADAGLTGILAEVSANGGSTWTTLATLKPTVTTVSLTKLNSNASYRVRLSAINAGGTSAPSTAVAGKTLLTTPLGLKVGTAKVLEVDLSWTALSGATGYAIEKSTDGKTFVAMDTSDLDGSDTSFVDSSADPGKKYFYHIGAINSAGTSVFSTAVTGNTLLSAPTGLAATSASASEIDLSWTAAVDPALTGYSVEISADNGSTWTVLAANQKATVATYKATGLKTDRSYRFRVSALSVAGPSASLVTKSTRLAAPTGVEAIVRGSDEIDLEWDYVAHATTYKVEQSTDGGTTWSEISPTGDNALGAHNSGLGVDSLDAGKSYKFRVSSINAAGASATTSITAMTLLAAPTGVTATAHGKTQINISWDAISNPNLLGYELLSSADGVHWDTVGTFDATTTHATDTHLTAATKYYYAVVAIDAAGQSDLSDSANATTAAAS